MIETGDLNDEGTMQRKHGLWQQAVAQTERVLRQDAHMTPVGEQGELVWTLGGDSNP